MKKSFLALALSSLFINVAHADNTEPNPLRFMVGIGLSVGGQTLATVQYDDGTSTNISSGTGGIVHAGVDYRFNESFSSQITVGYQFRETPDAKNGSASFTRIPVDVLAYYHPDHKWRIGVGAEFVESPSINASGAASGIGTDFKNTTGAILEAEYFFSPHMSVKMRGVKESYTPSWGGPSVNGSYGAVIGDYYF